MWCDREEEGKSEVQLGFGGQMPMKTTEKYLKIYENSEILFVQYLYWGCTGWSHL